MVAYFIRVGALGELFRGSGPDRLPPSRQVLVRTDRGLQVGQIVGPASEAAGAVGECLQILRPTTHQDELLIRRLTRHKREAVEACRSELARAGSTATLLDIDQLFDGSRLIMHFLGPVDEQAERITRRVAERYESIVRSRHFAKQLAEGCGPGCGTATGGGCGNDCQGCAVAAACNARES